MGLAFQMVRAGAAPVMLAGGAEAMLCFGGLKAWEGLRDEDEDEDEDEIIEDDEDETDLEREDEDDDQPRERAERHDGEAFAAWVARADDDALRGERDIEGVFSGV